MRTAPVTPVRALLVMHLHRPLGAFMGLARVILMRTSTSTATPRRATFGRWPYLAAAAVLPAWALVAARRGALAKEDRWVADLALPILLAHQTEEWVEPGGFLPFANQRLLGSDRPTWPLTERLAFHVNVTAGWGSALAGSVLWRRNPAVAAGVVAMEIGNVAMHAGTAIRERRYNPGLITAVTLMAPHAACSIARLRRSKRMAPAGVVTAAAIGAAFAALPVSMKARMRRAARATGVARTTDATHHVISGGKNV